MKLTGPRVTLLVTCLLFAGMHSCEAHGAISELDEILDEPDAAVSSPSSTSENNNIVPEMQEEEIVQGEEDFLMDEERRNLGEELPVESPTQAADAPEGLSAAMKIVQAARVFHGRSNGRFDSQRAMQDVQLAMSRGDPAARQARLDRLWSKWTAATPTLSLEASKPVRAKPTRKPS